MRVDTPPLKTTRQKVDRRPVSTFWQKSYWSMTYAEKLCYMATCPPTMHELKDEDRGPVPRQSVLRENLFIISRAIVPLLIHSVCYWLYPGTTWPAYAAYPFYFFNFIAFTFQVNWRMVAYAVRFGTFDEKNIGRDRTPDKSVNKLAIGVTTYLFLRPGMDFFLHYKRSENPLESISWDFPLRLMAWQLTLDYFFYLYHRACHEIDFLWFIHQHHHTTKHPTAILAILAEDYQEVLEIFMIPFVTSLIIPMSFAELWMTMCYTLYVEMLGHSGIRAYWLHPTLWVLKPIGCELSIEDHDLHHQHGKSGKN